MPHTLIYWAPEVINLQRYGTAADMWSLGVTMYQIVTGEHPFNTGDEQNFRFELTNARIDYSRLMGHNRLRSIIQNLLIVDPAQRWDANMVLQVAQHDFVIDIQRVFRGFKARLDYRRMRHGLVLIQSAIKGFVTRANY
jgi:eukaryotic-like serine/threonine-protein kinase